MGLFHAFRDDPVRLTGVEAAGEGLDTARHGASLSRGRPGVLHGSFSSSCRRAWGQVLEAHSVSAGLDYPGVGPEHSWLKDSGRALYAAATDAEALAAFRLTARLEGIIPALESAHALAYVLRGPGASTRFAGGDLVIVNLSGRGDKDVHEAARLLAGAGPDGAAGAGPGAPTTDAGAAAGTGEREGGVMTIAHGAGLAPRLRAAFAAPRAANAALIPYLTAGHPDLATSHRLIATLIAAGADIVELGVPFSDPIADGPVVQRSTHEALLSGVTPEHVFELAAAHSAAGPVPACC